MKTNTLKKKIKQTEITLSGLKEYLIYKNEIEKDPHPMYSKKEVIRMINYWEGYVAGLKKAEKLT